MDKPTVGHRTQCLVNFSNNCTSIIGRIVVWVNLRFLQHYIIIMLDNDFMADLLYCNVNRDRKLLLFYLCQYQMSQQLYWYWLSHLSQYNRVDCLCAVVNVIVFSPELRNNEVCTVVQWVWLGPYLNVSGGVSVAWQLPASCLLPCEAGRKFGKIFFFPGQAVTRTAQWGN